MTEPCAPNQRAKRDEPPQPPPVRPSRPNPMISACCGGGSENAHGFGICWGPRVVGRLRGYRPTDTSDQQGQS